MTRQVTTIHGEPSYTLESDRIKLAVTRRGGHMGPVRFKLGNRWVSPYSLAPWKPDECAGNTPPILRVLRGDFLCLPFGGDGDYVHGETANLTWRQVKSTSEHLRLRMKLKRPSGSVAKTIGIRPGERAVYQEHMVSGVEGRFNFGHHAILKFPDDDGPYHINVSPFRYGSTKPEPFTDPAIGEYSALKVNATFHSLDRVPLASGGTTSLRKVPAREGYEDLVMVSSRPGDFAWTAATLDGYVWISLKDPRILPSTLFWLSNGGRHYPPWNGRHRRRIGLEEVNSHFSDGHAVSRKDLLKKKGVPTTRAFSAKEPTCIRMIHVVHPVPRAFGRVERIERDSDGESILVSNNQGKAVRVPVNWRFLYW